jgi:hypothetical protein
LTKRLSADVAPAPISVCWLAPDRAASGAKKDSLHAGSRNRVKCRLKLVKRAMTNYQFLAHAVLSTDETVDRMARPLASDAKSGTRPSR